MPPPFRALLASLPSVALLLVLTLPFAGRAHHIDDPLYLAAARQAWDAPLDPLGGSSFWHDQPTTLFHDLYNPPLTAYLLAVPVALGGGSERPVHLVMILLTVATLAATAWAGEAFGVGPRWTLLLAASPALCVASVGAMADVPFLLLTVLAWGAAARGRAGVNGLLVGLGALTKYVGLLNVPLSLVALARSGRWKTLVSLATAAGLFLAWCLWSLSAYGQTHVAAASRFQAFGLRRQGEFLLSFVAALGLAGLPSALGLLRWTRGTAAASILAGAGGAFLVHGRGAGPATMAVGFAAFGCGAALLIAAWRASRREIARDPFLPACFWSFAGYSVLLVYFGAARYVLPALPPLLWLLARSGEAERGTRRWILSVGAGALISLLVLWGDAGYANAWRTAAARLPREGRRFETGHWGFQWYAGGQGYAPLAPRDVPESGDIVAEAQGIHGARPSPAQSALLTRLSVVTVPSPWLRVMDRRAQAGLYSSAWGLLPFGFRSPAEERVRVSTPAAWVLRALADPPVSPVAVDLGSEEGRQVQLDGWSGDEAFEDASGRTTFVWAVGPESALRLPLPRGVVHVRLRASPGASAVGRLRVSLGTTASAIVDLTPGWRIYDARVEGAVPGGPTTIVLQPAGHGRPGPLGREDRPLSVAVDALVFGADDPGGNRGVWPVLTEAGGPGLLVAASAATLLEGTFGRVRGRVRVTGGSAELKWTGADGAAAWSGTREGCASGCAFDVAAPAAPARLVLRADHAILSDLEELSASR